MTPPAEEAGNNRFRQLDQETYLAECFVSPSAAKAAVTGLAESG